MQFFLKASCFPSNLPVPYLSLVKMNRVKLTPEDERLFRARFPRASYWVFGTKLSDGDQSKITHPGGFDRLRTRIPASTPIRAGGSAIQSVKPAAWPFHNLGPQPSTPTDTLPEGYLGPCWDCIAESSFHMAHGSGDEVASSILGSCRHNGPSNSLLPLPICPSLTTFSTINPLTSSIFSTY